MNALVTHEVAMARIDELHREADHARLVRSAKASRQDSRVPSHRRAIWRRRPAISCC